MREFCVETKEPADATVHAVSATGVGYILFIAFMVK